jgi:hypothetical protein
MREKNEKLFLNMSFILAEVVSLPESKIEIFREAMSLLLLLLLLFYYYYFIILFIFIYLFCFSLFIYLFIYFFYLSLIKKRKFITII